MGLFGKKQENEEIEDDELDERSPSPRKFRDLAPQNRKKRKEVVRPWGRGERIFVLATFLITILGSGMLAAQARFWKLPGIPRITLPSFSDIRTPLLGFLGEDVIEIGGDGKRLKLVAKAKKITSEFRSATNDLSGLYALYVVDLDSGFSFGVNEGTLMQAASLIKLPIIASVFLEAEAGNLNLDDYRDLVKAMGKRSDNSAQIKVVDSLGKETVHATIRNLGMQKTSLEENETTPQEVGKFFQKLWHGEIVKISHRDEILEYLTDTIYEDWLTAGVPEGVRVAHKYGVETNVVNDAGIVFADNPYIVVVMTKGIVAKEANEIFPTISKIVYEGMVN